MKGEKAKGGEGEHDSKGPQPPPPHSKGSQLHESFAHPWVAVKIISHTPYYQAPKYYHAHDNERGGFTREHTGEADRPQVNSRQLS